MNSYNHYAYGAVCQWLFESVAGVAPDPAHPGFDRVILNPQILPALSPVAAWHDCRHGRIDAGWTLDGDLVRYAVTLPDRCSGQLLPNPRHGDVTVDGLPLTVPEAGLILTPGHHDITFRVKP
jgi:alpha-L-rhamnosidase